MPAMIWCIPLFCQTSLLLTCTQCIGKAPLVRSLGRGRGRTRTGQVADRLSQRPGLRAARGLLRAASFGVCEPGPSSDLP